jgi:uncharacterized membrane protein YedE/YeeE
VFRRDRWRALRRAALVGEKTMNDFTPVSALIGGAIIGLSAATLWLGIGRVAGISGIVGNIWAARMSELGWRVAFLVGLIAAPLLWRLAGGALPEVTVSASPLLVVAGGLLVGFGTRLGSGCTSGHGICGIARLSRRSIAATATFMASAIVVVFVARHVIGG